jgi:photoactive yellow protein
MTSSSAQDQDLYSFLRDKGLTAQESAGDDRTSAASSREAAPDDAAPDPSSREGGPRPMLDFDAPGIGEELRHASRQQLNQADFGIVGVDDEGVVQFYNTYESELAGVEPEEARGQNFFTQLAPCSNNRIFLGRFKKGVRTGELDEQFSYTFTYKMRPTLVDIRLYRDEAGNNWVMVRKR